MKKKNPTFLPVTEKVNPTQRKSLGLGAWQGPRVRHPDEALPNRIDRLSGLYTPQDTTPIRPGASDHLEIKTKGVRC